MSEERPAAPKPERAPADSSRSLEPEAEAPADGEPTLPQHTIEPTRTSMVWTMIGIGVVLLVAILVFILQNGQRVRVRFLMANAARPGPGRGRRRCTPASPPDGRAPVVHRREDTQVIAHNQLVGQDWPNVYRSFHSPGRKR
jgi:hypothetical protein